MKRDGQLTAREAQTVCRALGILQDWLTLHQNDEHTKYGFWDLYSSHRELSGLVYITYAE
jgi:hypothetical protein